MSNKRHVRSEWKLLEPPEHYNRARALCGKLSTPSNCGVPGITREGSSGWCMRCINLLHADISSVTYTLPTLQYIHSVIAAEVKRIKGGESTVLPLWHKYSESINNRRWIVWDTMMSRCYDQMNPDYPGWGGNGITVHPDWHNFTAFVDDVPDNVVGVFPSSREISKATAIVHVTGVTSPVGE